MMPIMVPLKMVPTEVSRWEESSNTKEKQGSDHQAESIVVDERRTSRESFRFSLQRTPSTDSVRRQSIPSSRKTARFLGRSRNKSDPRHSTDEQPTRLRAQSASSSDTRSVFSADAVDMEASESIAAPLAHVRKRSMLSRLTKSSIVSKAAPLHHNSAPVERWATPIGQVGFAVAYPDMRTLAVFTGKA